LLLRFLLWPPCPCIGSYLSLVFITCADHVQNWYPSLYNDD
jgi:hypothetical protein